MWNFQSDSYFFFMAPIELKVDLWIIQDLDKDLFSSLMFPESQKNYTRTDLADFLLFFHLIYKKSTSSRIKKFWIPKPTSLHLWFGVLTLWKWVISLINGFQQIFPFLSFSSELPTKEPQVIWTTFKGLCIENGFLVLCTQLFQHQERSL